MKKLIVLAVLVVAVLAGIWIGCRCAPMLVSPTPVEEPASVVEPTPTEKIEEPTPTPVPPTPTSVPPTPTPEPTPVPPTPTPEPMHYVGLPPVEVQRLREQCLRENPDSLCLPLPVDPTQPGVEIFVFQDIFHPEGKDEVRGDGELAIKAPAGTIFYAFCTGTYALSHPCSKQDGEWICDYSSGAPVLRCGLYEAGFELADSSRLIASDFSDPGLYDKLQHGGIQVTLGDVLFTLKTSDPIVHQYPESWGLQNQPNAQVLVHFFSDDQSHSFSEDDLLRDDQGRIVFIKP